MTLTTATTTTAVAAKTAANVNIADGGGQQPLSSPSASPSGAVPSRRQNNNNDRPTTRSTRTTAQPLDELPVHQHKFCGGYLGLQYCGCSNMRNTVYITNIIGIILSIFGILLFAVGPLIGFEERNLLPEFVFDESSEQYKFRIYFTLLLNITFHCLSLRGVIKHIDWMLRVSTAWFMLVALIPFLIVITRFNDIITTTTGGNNSNSKLKFLLLLIASVIWNVVFVVYPHCILIREARLGISLQPPRSVIQQDNQW